MTILIALLTLSTLAAGWVTFPLLCASSDTNDADLDAASSQSPWREEKDRLVREMVALDVAVAEGRISHEECFEQRGHLMAEAEEAAARSSQNRLSDEFRPARPSTYPRLALVLVMTLLIGVTATTILLDSNDIKRGSNPHANGSIPLPTPIATSEKNSATTGRLGEAASMTSSRAGTAPDIGAMVAGLEKRVAAGNVTVDEIIMLARSYRVLNREAEAIDLYRRAHSMAAQDQTVSLVVASALIHSSQEKDRSDGAVIIDRVLSSEPEKPEALWLKSLGFIQKHEIEPARKILEKLVLLVENNPAAKAAVASMIDQIDAATPAKDSAPPAPSQPTERTPGTPRDPAAEKKGAAQ